MNKNKKLDKAEGLIPELRFPQFAKEGEWEKQTLGKVLQFQTGFPFDSQGFNEDGNGIRLVKNRDLKSDDKVVFYSKPFDERYLVDDGDVLIGMDGDFTPCVWQKGKALLNQRVGRILANKKEQERFFYYFLSIHLKTIEERTARTTVKHLSHSDVERINEPLPKRKEQQKIASCLSSLDEVIAAQGQKLNLLKDHKKGLMQNLFPQEGEKVPKYRFREFEKDGEWVEKKLGDYFQNLSTGMTPSREKPEYFKGEIPWITSGELNYNVIYRTNENITEEAVKKTNLRLYKPGTFFMAITGLEAPGTRGKCAINGVRAATNQSCMAFEENSNVDNKFLFYWYLNFGEDLYRYAQGTKQQSYNNNIVERFTFIHPSIQEQQRIASCLSSLDELIKVHAENVDQLKLHKKGLMQGLFPKMND